MSPFEVASIVVAGSRGEDRALVLECGEGFLLAVADGAGGSGGGGQAADVVIREIRTAGADAFARDEAGWCELLRQIDQRIPEGESTAVVLAVSAGGVVGASVGDSCAWLVADGELHDLTRGQARKPLLGSGGATPVGFSGPAPGGVLLLATDGFCNYVRRNLLPAEVPWIDFAVLPTRLVEMVTLPSGSLWDDVAVVACRPRRGAGVRRRYDLGAGPGGG